MAHRPLILTLAAGAALTVATSACTGSKQPEEVGSGSPFFSENPPPPKPPPEPPTANPPPPEPVLEPATGNPPPPAGPTTALEQIRVKSPDRPEFEDVKSPHPEGATNPPSPVLIVTPAGDCFKRWEGGMIPSDGDRVESAVADAMTTAVNCPEERAEALLKAHAAGDDGGSGKKAPSAPAEGL